MGTKVVLLIQGKQDSSLSLKPMKEWGETRGESPCQSNTQEKYQKLIPMDWLYHDKIFCNLKQVHFKILHHCQHLQIIKLAYRLVKRIYNIYTYNINTWSKYMHTTQCCY